MVGIINQITKMIMNKLIIILLISVGGLTACKKNDFNFTSSSYPSIPVTVTNLYSMTNGVPTVVTSLSGGGTITITLAIPSGSGRTIKEISRVGIASTPSNYKVVETTSGLYNTSPI